MRGRTSAVPRSKDGSDSNGDRLAGSGLTPATCLSSSTTETCIPVQKLCQHLFRVKEASTGSSKRAPKTCPHLNVPPTVCLLAAFVLLRLFLFLAFFLTYKETSATSSAVLTHFFCLLFSNTFIRCSSPSAASMLAGLFRKWRGRRPAPNPSPPLRYSKLFRKISDLSSSPPFGFLCRARLVRRHVG